MSRRRRKLLNKTEELESNFDLDLAPMLALMVTLIPIMLLSTVFVKVTLIETPLPQIVQKAIEEDLNKKEKQVSLSLNMDSQSGFKLNTFIDGKLSATQRLPKINGRWDLEGLYKAAYKVKVQHPKIFGIDLNPQSEVSYEDIVKVIDELRNIKKEDQKVIITDRDTKQKEQSDIMFPNVSFGNVVEG